MKFDKKVFKSIRIKKINHMIHKDCMIYLNENYPIFGMVEIHGVWLLIHTPTERPVTKSFYKKEQLEEYFDFLDKEIDLNAIILYNLDYDDLQTDLRDYIELAYCKYIANKKRSEKSNNHYN
jgi:hypothetical protein